MTRDRATGVGPGEPRPYATSLVGREIDLAALDALAAQGERLVTLLGPGGVGKTRLACEHARRARDAGATVRFCDLADARDLDDVCSAVAHGLGASLGVSRGESVARLGDALAALGPALVVLDNFEQVAACAAACIPAWLARAPAVRIVVTSRGRLRLGAERVHEVQPLRTTPRQDARAPAVGAEAGPDEATALLIDRVGRARGAYGPGPDERAALAAIARALDGLPLALELAATRVAALGAAAVRARLAHALDLLSHGGRDAAARHATLRGVIDWSYELLAPPERDALARFALFRGGFSLEGAEAVVGRADALDLLHALRDASLVRADDDAAGLGTTRFALYPAVREYAAERLARDAALDADAHDRAAAFFVREAGARLAASGPTVAGAPLAWLVAERDNLEAVAHRALARGDLPVAAHAALALAPVARSRGPLEPHAALLDALLERAAGDDAPGLVALRAQLLRARGQVHIRRGDAARSEADLVESARLARAVGDAALEGRALAFHAYARHLQGALDEALAIGERALALHRAAGDARAEGPTLIILGASAWELGRLDLAERMQSEALARASAQGDAATEALARVHASMLALQRGRRDASLALAIRAHAGALAAGDRVHVLLARIAEGHARHALGEPDAAIACYDEARSLARALGRRNAEATALGSLGHAHAARGELLAAWARFDEAAALFTAADDAPYGAAMLAARALVEWLRGDAASARATLDGAEVLLPDPRAPYRAAVDAVRDALDGRGVAGEPRDEPVFVQFVRALIRANARASAALVVDGLGRWFELPSGTRIDCGQRRSTRRLLVALVARGLEAPGTPIGPEALIAAAWPGERLPWSVAINRLRVALSALRKLGLRDALLNDGQGYMLDPALPLRRV